MRIVVIVPVGGQTGGVELLYQFVDAMRHSGADAFVCGYPFKKQFSIPEAYKKYECSILTLEDIAPTDIIVVPEVYTQLWKYFKNNKIYMWWLSVDNYYNSRHFKYNRKNGFWPWDFKSIKDPRFKSYFSGHLCQSQYAIEHLNAAGIHGGLIVSDYINNSFLSYSENLEGQSRRNIVVYNPAKGARQTRKILDNSEYEFHAIKNMAREEVMSLLASAKVYIDFGNHPGKDRIPREAAALGCVILTNKMGSAANNIDIEIDDELKIDDGIDGFEMAAAEKIRDIMLNFGEYSQRMSSYRTKISREEGEFKKSVNKFLNSLKD